MEHQMAESENEIRARDETISNLKLIITRITANNNDMLAILVNNFLYYQIILKKHGFQSFLKNIVFNHS